MAVARWCVGGVAVVWCVGVVWWWVEVRCSSPILVGSDAVVLVFSEKIEQKNLCHPPNPVAYCLVPRWEVSYITRLGLER